MGRRSFVLSKGLVSVTTEWILNFVSHKHMYHSWSASIGSCTYGNVALCLCWCFAASLVFLSNSWFEFACFIWRLPWIATAFMILLSCATVLVISPCYFLCYFVTWSAVRNSAFAFLSLCRHCCSQAVLVLPPPTHRGAAPSLHIWFVNIAVSFVNNVYYVHFYIFVNEN